MYQVVADDIEASEDQSDHEKRPAEQGSRKKTDNELVPSRFFLVDFSEKAEEDADDTKDNVSPADIIDQFVIH